MSGALNTLTNFLWRQFSTAQADKDIYGKISQAVTDIDPINAGAGFGEWWRAFLMIDIPSGSFNDDYECTGGLGFKV